MKSLNVPCGLKNKKLKVNFKKKPKSEVIAILRQEKYVFMIVLI